MLIDLEGVWLSSQETGDRLGISASRVRQLAGDGAFPSKRLIGRNLFVLEREVLAYERKPTGYPAGRKRKKSQIGSDPFARVALTPG